MTLSLPTVTEDFIDGNQKLCQTMSKSRRGGRYSKQERITRRDEVYRLHFEYGYSARKISELMNINRNTINVDIDYWYSKIKQNTNILNPEDKIIETLERFKVQRTRLREQIDKVKDISEKIAIERLLFDVDSKICYTFQRIAESRYRIHGLATTWMNQNLKNEKKTERAITYYDTVKVSAKARERISRIIKEDKGRKF
ncbi:MAG: hypothetical protein HY222_00650 [Thaumarchaeota archaeon]|nr:hypothetical protein [Nitrososphaerota archaeon]MBI3640894.1 hypothetical protein [Nitrososphaerota archaeon]